MTPEAVFKAYRAYRLYYNDKFDFQKYRGKIKTPPLLQQPDRRFFYRISQKLQDRQIHALFVFGFFYKPAAYIADLATPDAFSKALLHASRAENGRTLLEHDLYDLRRRVPKPALDAWLYGELLDNGERAMMPGCLQDLMNGELAPDLACLLLLIPQPQWGFQWTQFFPTSDFGAQPWVERLKKLDQLIRMHRPGWRILSHELAKTFWTQYASNETSLAPYATTTEATLF